MLFCLVAVFSCDNRKVCIEADDFGFEDIERFDVQSFLSPQNEEDSCSYREGADGFSSSNTDLHYCLNGAIDQEDHCAESYDGYVSYRDSSTIKYCRFINNDLDSELTSLEVSCVSPSNIGFVNKGCNIGSTNIPIGRLFVLTASSWASGSFDIPLPAIAEIKANCVASCVERCRKKRACSHIASRQPIKNGAADVTSGALYDIFNPYTGTFLLKHSLDGNLFAISPNVSHTTSAGDVDNYQFTWTDSSSELKQMFSQLTSVENKKKLSLAISDAQGRSILIDDFDSCNLLLTTNPNTFTCIINKNRDLATKDKFSRFFPTPPATSISFFNAVAIFDYVKIRSGGINTEDRTITTYTQHHFGTNSILEIVSSSSEYKIKVKKILHNKQFIYEDIAGQANTISAISSNCSSGNCFLIPSLENVDLQDKFMPSWKATTSKSSATATGGLQISAGSKVEIKATGTITLGSSEEKVCHKNISNDYNPNLYEDVGGLCGTNSKTFNFITDTKYQPNVKIISIPTSLTSKYTFYRSLTNTEKAAITHSDPTYNDLCKSFCYSDKASPTAQNHFACDVSVPHITNGTSTHCKYNGTTIETQYNSEKEQVRIANYAKRVFIDSSSVLEEALDNFVYTPPAPSVIAFDANGEASYVYSSSSMPSEYGDRPLLAYFDGLGTCEIKVKIMNSDFPTTGNARDNMYKNLDQDALSIDGATITGAANKPSILYPGTKLLIKKTSGDCQTLTITPYPYIEFTAIQSGFVAFKSANACQLKQVRVANNNTSYPKQKITRNATTGVISLASNSNKHNIFTGNQFVDAVLNKIFNAILNIYHSFAAVPAVVADANPYNQQGVNNNFQVCDACFSSTITKTVVNNTCITANSGCGGLRSSIASYDINGFPTTTPQDGKPGKITITFLDGEELVYNNPGVYHLSFDADRKITKIEAIGGGGGASYDFGSLTTHNGGDAQILKIEESSGINITASADSNYKTENSYTLKIMVGSGGKNSTEINNYKTFSGLSHRDSYNYALYKKDFGYAGGFGDASVIGFVHKTIPNKIKILAVASGGGGGAGKTCNDPAMFGNAGFNDNISNHDILHNSTYDYLQGIIKCNAPGERFLQNLAVPKVACGSPLTGFPGRCVSGTCSIVGANTASGQSTESTTVNHGDTIYCITGYTQVGTTLTANCAVASGFGTIVGGSCNANSCTAVLSGATGTGATASVANAISTGNLIPSTSSQPASPSPMAGLSCGTGYAITWSGNGINKATCTNNPGVTNVEVGRCTANACNAILTSATTVSGVYSFGTGATTSVAISTGTAFSSATTIAGLSCGADYNLSWGSGTAVCNGSDIPVGNCTKNCPASNLDNANHGSTTIYLNGETATCNSGYGGTGTQTRTCNNGTWSGGNNSCTANVCSINPTALTGYTPPATLTHNTSKPCDSGYTGTVTLSCTAAAGGTATTSGSCTAITCTPTNAVANSLYNGNSYNTSTSFAYNSSGAGGLSCNAGYTASANLGYTCTTSGTTTINGSCTAITCTPTSVVANSLYNGNSYNTSTSFPYNSSGAGGLSCATGYTASANLGYTCTTSGTTSISGTCNINTCPLLNYSDATSARNYNTTATCTTGYGGTGTQTRTCQDDGTWSGSCNPNNCSYTYNKYNHDQDSPTSATITINHGQTAIAPSYNCEYKQPSLTGTARGNLGSSQPNAVLLNHGGDMKLSCSFGSVSQNSYCPDSSSGTAFQHQDYRSQVITFDIGNTGSCDSSGCSMTTINNRVIRAYSKYYKDDDYNIGAYQDTTTRNGTWCALGQDWQTPNCYNSTWCRTCANDGWWGGDPVRGWDRKKTDTVVLYCPNGKFNGSNHIYGLCDM